MKGPARRFKERSDDSLHADLAKLKGELVSFQNQHRRLREDAHKGALAWFATVGGKHHARAAEFCQTFTSGGPPLTRDALVDFVLGFLLVSPEFKEFVRREIDESPFYSPLSREERDAEVARLQASIHDLELEADRRATERHAKDALAELERRATGGEAA